MADSSLRYRQFACPQEPFDERVFATIVTVHARGVVELFLSEHRAAVAAGTSGLLDLVDRWLAAEPDAETVWDSAFGRLQRALELRDVDPVDAAVHLALRLSATGLAGRWSGSFAAPTACRWDDWLLRAGRDLVVAGDGRAVTVRIGAAGAPWHEIGFTRAGAGWNASGGAQRLASAGVRRPIRLLAEPAIRGQLEIEDEFGSIVGFPPIEPALVAPVDAALRVLADHAPAYLGWVERVLRGIVICRCRETRTRSSSWSEAPGIILMSATPDPLAVAEMLVHEASHQLFHLVGWLGPVDDGTDTRLYYSPAVNRGRPLSRVLIAYHAFANVLLAYRTVLAGGLRDDGGWAAVEARLREDVEVLERPLRDNPALTELGRALCRPLIERTGTVAGSPA